MLRRADNPASRTRSARVAAITLAAVLAYPWALPSTAADIDVSPVPPGLLRDAPPNLILTVDNAASMARAFSPSALAGYASGAAFTSPDVNRLYYDPSRLYRPGLDADGLSLGDADFAAAVLYPYLGEGCRTPAPIDLRIAYRVVYDDPPPTRCSRGGEGPAGGEAADAPSHAPPYAPPGPAYYHLYDPSNRYDPSGTIPPRDCGPAGFGSAVTGAVSGSGSSSGAGAGFGCRRCGDDFASPAPGTPDQCFDRIVVGSAADLAISRCADVARSADNPTGLKLRGRLAGVDCVPRALSGDAAPAAADAETNFANWLVYHRSRLLRAKTLLSHLLHALSPATRLAYQTTDATSTLATDDGGPLAPRFSTPGRSKTEIFDWLFALRAEGPGLLQAAHARAGVFVAGGIAQADDIALHRLQPRLSERRSCGAGCRRNLHLVVSDGEWRDVWAGGGEPWPCPASAAGCGYAPDDDGRGAPLPGNPFGIGRYHPSGEGALPYADDNVGMLADLSFRFWRGDLDPDAPNLLPPRMPFFGEGDDTDTAFWHPGNDPATWQHLNLYAIGFGGGAVEPLEAWPFGRYGADGEGVAKHTLAEDGFPSVDAAVYDNDAAVGDAGGGADAAGASGTGAGIGTGTGDAAAPGPAARADDLYHAVLNARGRYADSARAGHLIGELTDVLDTVRTADVRQATSAPLVVSRARVDEQTLLLQTRLDSDGWSGDLLAFRVSRGSGSPPCPGRELGSPCGFPEHPLWRASEQLPAPGARVIFTSADGEPAVFRPGIFSVLSKSQQRGLLGCAPNRPAIGDFAFCRLDRPLPAGDPRRVTAEARIAYLRGERSAGDGAPKADSSAPSAGADPVASFRVRRGLLGDMVNSTPVVVGPPKGCYADPDYAAFRARHEERPEVVYAGANDGMLHAFSATSGVETFAYVPEAIYARLADLTEPGYGDSIPKRAFVDGGIATADVRITDRRGRTAWRTVLIASMGLGAQGVFALDITRSSGLRETDAEDVVLWEFTDASVGRAGLDGREMGFATSPPAIVRIDDNPADGNPPHWVALVANGYNSTRTDLHRDIAGHCSDDDPATACTVSETGAAVLYVLDIGGGDDTRIRAAMDTGAGAGHPASLGRSNALGPVTAVDVDGDLIADQAYAGDLFGNLWRFDLTDLSEPPSLMFEARDDDGKPQPITSRIAYLRHPTGIGALLLFGTGQYLASADNSDRSVQSFYGIWDDNGEVHGTAGHDSPPSRTELLRQSFIRMGAGGSDAAAPGGGAARRASQYRISSDEKADWRSSGHRGWRIDLVTDAARPDGERVVAAPRELNGRVVFSSIVPGSCCAGGAGGWLTVLDATDGSRPTTSPLQNPAGAEARTGVLVSSIGLSGEQGPGAFAPPAVTSLGNGVVQMLLTGADGEAMRLLEETGSVDWRNWRQLR
ncbi:MAG: hypothetical protein K9M02_09565 [Thiohalocapsa sp.]|nr:hypothetical protein [Thiohalocapsa sp.]